MGRRLVTELVRGARGFHTVRLRTDGEAAARFCAAMGFARIAHADATHIPRLR